MILITKTKLLILPKKQGFWRKRKDYWYCADSRGELGYTIIDPGTAGYCAEGGSVVCPPFVEK